MLFRVKFSAFIAASLLLAASAEAGLLTTDSATPVAAGHWEAELNGAYSIDKEQDGGVTAKCHVTDSDLTVTAGLTDGADISIILPYTMKSREKIGGRLARRSDGLNDLTVTVKYRLFDRNGLILAIKPGLILPTGKAGKGLSDGRLGMATALLVSRELAAGKLKFHANAGYEHHGYKEAAIKDSSRADIFTFSVAAEALAAAGLTLAVDFGLATAADKSVDTAAVYALGGAAYEFNRMLETYAGIKAGLTRPEADLIALVGIKLKF